MSSAFFKNLLRSQMAIARSRGESYHDACDRAARAAEIYLEHPEWWRTSPKDPDQLTRKGRWWLHMRTFRIRNQVDFEEKAAALVEGPTLPEVPSAADQAAGREVRRLLMAGIDRLGPQRRTAVLIVANLDDENSVSAADRAEYDRATGDARRQRLARGRKTLRQVLGGAIAGALGGIGLVWPSAVTVGPGVEQIHPEVGGELEARNMPCETSSGSHDSEDVLAKHNNRYLSSDDTVVWHNNRYLATDGILVAHNNRLEQLGDESGLPASCRLLADRSRLEAPGTPARFSDHTG